MRHSSLDELSQRPIIAAVRSPADVGLALETPVGVIFLLSGHLLDVVETVRSVRERGRLSFVHVDLIDGLANNVHGLRWLAEMARPTGVITTRSSLIAAARALNLITVQRVFLLDSQSVRTGIEVTQDARPDVVEVLPGILPEAIREVAQRAGRPLIAGGFIKTLEQCRAALTAGACAVSTSSKQLWRLAGDASLASRRDGRELAGLGRPRH